MIDIGRRRNVFSARPKIKTPLGEPKGELLFLRNPLARATGYFFFLAGAFLAAFFAAFLVAFFIV